MKKHLFTLLSIVFSVLCYAQERINHNEIYLKDKLAYTKADNKLFTGIAESRTGKGHLTFEEEYKEGYKTKYILYYNGDDVVAATETLYQDNSFLKKKESRFSGDGSKVRYIH